MDKKTDEFGKVAVSIKDAVRVSGIGRSKLYEVMKSGELPARKLGTRTIILFDDLMAYLDGLPPYCGKKRTIPCDE